MSADTIAGGAGDDTISASGGDDGIRATSGADQIAAGSGNDTIASGLGDDEVLGAQGQDAINGGGSDDTISAGSGNDLIAGGDGSDSLSGGFGFDRVTFQGNFSSYTLARLGDGSLQMNDGAGNVDVLATDIEFLKFADRGFDLTIPPSVPVIGAITTDTGASSSDFTTADRRLIISGTSERHVTVEIFLDGISIGTAASGGTKNWSLDYTGTALADGSYTLSANATNVVLVTGSTGGDTALTIDTVAPSAPSTPNLAAASDTGTSNSDNITSDNTPTLTGTAEAGAIVGIYDGSALIETVTADTSGNWSFTAATLADGTYNLNARATDAAGNGSAASASTTVTIDTTAPAAPLIIGYSDDTGAPGDGVTLDRTLLISGTAEANSIVTVFDGAALLGTATTNDSGNWSFATATLNPGDNSFGARATDLAGHVGPGSATTLAVRVSLDINVATMPIAHGFRIFGADARDYAGVSVSSAGDVNGDGFDDLIIGAHGDGVTNAKNLAGEAIVVFGKSSGFADIDVSTMTAAQGFRIFGADKYDTAGETVSSAGDINGDGFDDLIIGAIFSYGVTNTKGRGAGEAIVVFGKASGFADIDVSTMTTAQGFRIFGADSLDYAGNSSSAGDINGDGFDDLIVGAVRADGLTNTKTDAGEAIVVFGKSSSFADIDVSTMTAARGFRIFGADANDYSASVASAGDVNGDGFDDLIIGAQGGDGVTNTKDRAGEAIVVFGKASGFADIDVSTMTTAQGFRIFGADDGGNSGLSVSSAGDVNGDGFDDLIIGTLFDGGVTDAGEAIVVFGKASGFADIDVSTMTTAQGFRIFGADDGDYMGQSVSSAGDVNGDGFDDLIIGATKGDGVTNTKTGAGEAIVVFGKASGFADIDISSMTAAQGFRIFGADARDYAGISVSSAGDINGDGFDDLIVGAFFADGLTNTKTGAGEAIVVFGGDFLGSVIFAGTNGADSLTGTSAAETFVGGQGNDVMSGNGGSDAFQGGEGNDRLVISDLAFRNIDGGHGTDTLALNGAGINFDLTTVVPAKIDSIERFDITGSGNNSLTLDYRDIFEFSGGSDDTFTFAASNNTFVVDGNSGDSLTLAAASSSIGSWVPAGNDIGLDGSAGGEYDIFDFTNGSTIFATLAVDKDMALTILGWWGG